MSPTAALGHNGLMSSAHEAHAHALMRFLDASPSPFHVVASAIEMLDSAGFRATAEPTGSEGPGRFYHARDGALLAWTVPDDATAGTPFRVVGAHTDSPNLRVKPRPDADAGGFRRVGVEVYGGVLLNSWLDRDLGISGRIVVRTDDGPDSRLVLIDEPVARIPQLAIHLDREVNDKGLVLNRQQHLGPITGLAATASPLLDEVAERADVTPTDLVGFDLMFHDLSSARLVGFGGEFLSSGRLDNQVSCHAAITALIGHADEEAVGVVSLFDHEEVGSVSGTGAATAMLPRVLAGITSALEGDERAHDRALADSLFVSADNAHATHPNYPERHDPHHVVEMNGGPVLKFNASQRYTTDGVSAGLFRLAAERAGVETQDFVSRSDMPCGSTIGPTVAAALGVRALDLGCAQLAMHSARELCGARDPWDLTLVLAEPLR